MKKTIILGIISFVALLMLTACGQTTSTEVADTEVGKTETTSQETIAEEESIPSAPESETTVVITGATETEKTDEAGANTEKETEAESAGSVDVKIEDYTFDQEVLTVSVGTTVIWTNYDSAPHTVTGDAFDSGTLQTGKTFSYRFTETGTYDYVCSFHPSMKGKIIVE